jgi:hypothetical protein
VRYRAKPLTVEVKRSNKRVPFTFTAVASPPSERHRYADQVLFGGLSSPTALAGRLKEGRLATHIPDSMPQAPAVEAVTSEIDVKAGRLQPTGRVLPDLLEQSRAEMRLRQDLEEREVRVRGPRGARGPSSGSRPKRAKSQTHAEADAGRKAAPNPTLTAEVSLKEPVLMAMEVVAPVATSSLRRPHGSQQRTESARGTTTRRANQAGGHRSERREAYVLLRAGEKWKRRLPRVCW